MPAPTAFFVGGEEGPPFGCHRLFKVGEIDPQDELGVMLASRGGYMPADEWTQLVGSPVG